MPINHTRPGSRLGFESSVSANVTAHTVRCHPVRYHPDKEIKRGNQHASMLRVSIIVNLEVVNTALLVFVLGPSSFCTRSLYSLLQ